MGCESSDPSKTGYHFSNRRQEKYENMLRVSYDLAHSSLCVCVFRHTYLLSSLPCSASDVTNNRKENRIMKTFMVSNFFELGKLMFLFFFSTFCFRDLGHFFNYIGLVPQELGRKRKFQYWTWDYILRWH